MTVRLNPNTGLLPVGEHEMDWRRVCKLFGTTEHRKYLLSRLHAVSIILRDAGVTQVWLDGSFITSTHRPGDYDMSYETSEEIFEKLPENPFKLRNASRYIRSQFAGDIKPEPMHPGATFRKDLFPYVVGHFHNGIAIEGVQKGIVVLPLRTLPNEYHS